MQKLLFVILFSIITLFSHSQGVVVRGIAKGAEGKIIRAQAYGDLISFRRFILDKDTIGNDGSFSLDFNLKHTAYVNLLIDFHAAEILLSPGQEYVIDITAFEKPDYRKELNPFLEPRYLYFILRSPENHLLMLSIDSLNRMYDQHLLENFRKLTRSGRSSGTDTLTAYFTSKLPYQSPYLDLVVKYRVALLKDLARAEPRDILIEQYIIKEKIMYSHPDYMEFFNSLFSKYLTHLSRRIPYGELAYRINELRSYPQVLDLLGRDSILQKDVIRELVLLRNLRELYYSPDFQKDAVLDILQQLSASSRFKEHREIAKNLIIHLSRLKKGSLPPPLEIIGSDGEKIKLSDYRGKHLYIQFYTSVCEACKADMTAMQTLRERYGEDVHFLSISIDEEKNDYERGLAGMEYDWDFTWFGGDFDIVDEYSLRAFPAYLFLDRDGKVKSYPAPGPAGTADRLFGRTLSAEKPKEAPVNIPGQEKRGVRD